jgi:hypothetical protein
MARFEVFAAMRIQVMVFRVVTTPCCLHLYPEDGDSMVLQNLGILHRYNLRFARR